MADARRSAGLGIGAALGVVLLVVLPYGIADARAIGVYYGGALGGPPLAALFAAVAAIALLGALRGRTDAPTAAGVALVLGVLVAGLVVPWAFGVSPALVGGLTAIALFEWHRWALAATGLALLAGSAGYARRVV